MFSHVRFLLWLSIAKKIRKKRVWILGFSFLALSITFPFMHNSIKKNNNKHLFKKKTYIKKKLCEV